MTVKQLKRGDYFTKKPLSDPGPAQVWIRGEYVRSECRYSCTRWSDVNDEQLIPGGREVYTGFTF